MQSSITQKFSLVNGLLTIKTGTGHLIQVRNHVKVYPWRRNRQSRECYLDNTKTPYTDKYNVNEFNSKKQRKPWQVVIPKDRDNRFNGYAWNDNYKSDPKEARETAETKFNRLRQSSLDRGHPRESKAYDPPANVQDRVFSIYRSTILATENHMLDSIDDDALLKSDINEPRIKKLNFITRCIKEFNHDMPSSYLNDMLILEDVVEYFSTPVRGVNPYTALLKDDSLPSNLALIPEPTRYDRETNQLFGKYSALPGIISKVPGLRGGKKYPVLNQDEFQWPDI